MFQSKFVEKSKHKFFFSKFSRKSYLYETVWNKQTIYVYRNIEAVSCNRCYSGKAMYITQTVCTFVALGIQHAKHMRHIIVCGLPLYTTFLLIVS